MARWIDASPAQRFHQYEAPGMRREIEAAPKVSADWRKMIARLFAQRHKHGTAHGGRQRGRREIKMFRTYLRNIADAKKRLAAAA